MRLSFKLIPLTVVCLFGLTLGAFGQQIQGNYETVGPVPKAHSLDVVRLEEFLNFTCPHCNNFREVAKPLFAKYGKRLKATYIPILFRGQSDGPLRLYFIAERAGRAEEMKNLIFDATFRYGVDINDPKIVSYLARSAGLAKAYEQEAHASWVDGKIKAAVARANAMGVEATPTIVLNGALRLVPSTGMNEFVANLDQVIAQLLKKQG
ncbi:MAG TPA: thioredoxin domain-containing protein [bacterium]|nr:thioredoxin domain-containing protein [bacterium]